MAGSAKRIKRANKKATKGINRGWKKGQSASYNPKCNKFRTEAKKKFLFSNIGESNLTEAKLAEHNKISIDEQCDHEDLMSNGGDTAISAFTNCSLPTFSRFISNWHPGSLLHKEMIAVLAAVSDVLKTHGGNETETEYFAALMTTLDVVDTDEGVTAVICLLAMVVKRLKQSVLKLQCDTSCDVFIKLLLKYMNSDHSALLTNLLKLIYAFLKEKSNWSESACEKLKVLFEFISHHKPKVRKTAHNVIQSLIVHCAPQCGLVQPGCAIATQFCISKLENSGGPNASKDVFYILSLLEETLGVFPKSSIKSICETILHVMTLSNSMVTSACLKALRGLFAMQPKSENLPSDLNAKLITAFYDYQPNVKESLLIANWLQLMVMAFLNLKKLDEKLCYSHLPKFFNVTVKYWQSDKNDILEVVTATLKDILYRCIQPHGEVFQQYLLDDAVNNPMHKMFHIVEEALNYQYHKAWKHVLLVLTAFFEVMGKHCYSVMHKCLESLADMHESKHRFPHISELEKAISMAIQQMGPEIVLQAIPLIKEENNISKSCDFVVLHRNNKPSYLRNWLLPLLRDNIKQTQLRFFIKYFLPLAEELKETMNSLSKEQPVHKLYEILWNQVWSLLPQFCNEPTDLKQCFKNADFAIKLRALLIEEPSLRMIVLSSLRVLITKSTKNEENKAVLSRFSKNYVPTLFNLYLTESKDKKEERVRLAVYETCKVFLRITDKELCKTYFEQALKKLLASEATDFMKHSMIDICRAAIPYVDASNINSIYEYCKPLLKDSNHTTRKKSYSVLNAICCCESISCKTFVKEHLEDIRPLLCGNEEDLKGLTPATRALRLSILASIIEQLSLEEKDFIISVILEAVSCTKQNSIKARSAAYNLLIVIGNAFLSWKSNDKEALSEYLEIIYAGLGGNPSLISGTMLALGRVLYEFKDKVDSKIIEILIHNACLLLTSKSREIVVSTMSFFKILFSILDKVDLAQHVESMVTSITSISEDNQRHFRFKAKELLTRLIRKFGFEMISKMVPENYRKQITHIRKMEAKKSRKKSFADEDDDDDELTKQTKASTGFESIFDDSDDEMPLETNNEKSVKMSKKKKYAETIIEEHEDDVIDLMDPSINQKLLTKNPEKSILKKTVADFPMSEDGRLIITEDDDVSCKKKENKEIKERQELLAELGVLFKKNKKRKYQESDDDDDENDTKATSSVTKGIHRTLNPEKQRVPGSQFKAKKAGGDVKKGKFEPYAYVPLNRQILNKRKQVKMKGQFKNLVKGAKKGAMIGAKRKMRTARKKKNKN